MLKIGMYFIRIGILHKKRRLLIGFELYCFMQFNEEKRIMQKNSEKAVHLYINMV